jgi:trans-aconitate methyltransferase
MASTSQTKLTTQTERTQTWDAARYAANGRFVAELAGEVLAMLDARSGERILDLGCGDGALTGHLIATSGADITGCDADGSMLTAARQRGLRTIQADMRMLPFEQEFDAVFSNAALHWVTDQASVIRGVHRALKPGGRFVAEMGGLGNIASIRTALSAVLNRFNLDAEALGGSFYPAEADYRRLLEANGFHVVTTALVPRPTLIKAGMEEWLRTFRTGVLTKLRPEDREPAIAEITALLRPILCDESGQWWADYVRLRFHAVRG